MQWDQILWQKEPQKYALAKKTPPTGEKLFDYSM